MDHTPSPCLPDGYHSVARWWWGTRGREILRWAFNVLWTVSGGPADGGFSDRVKGEGEGDCSPPSSNETGSNPISARYALISRSSSASARDSSRRAVASEPASSRTEKPRKRGIFSWFRGRGQAESR